MKRYLLFCFSDYYPSGGLGDVRFSADSIQEITDWLLIDEKGVWNSLSDYNYVWDRIEDKEYELDSFDLKTFKEEKPPF